MNPCTLAAAALLLAGCALIESPTVPETLDDDPAVTFSLRAEAGNTVARIDDRAIESPDVGLARIPDRTGSALLGKAFGRPVNLDASAGSVAGLVGGRPLDLTVSRVGAALHAKGLVRGGLSDFRLDEGEARGTLGACSYELVRAGDRYEGRRSCGGPSERVTLHLPYSISAWSDAEEAAALAVLLGAR